MAPHQKEHEGVLVEGTLVPMAAVAVRPADAGVRSGFSAISQVSYHPSGIGAAALPLLQRAYCDPQILTQLSIDNRSRRFSVARTRSARFGWWLTFIAIAPAR